MAKYNVLVDGSVIYSGLQHKVAKRVVDKMIQNEYTNPTMECKFNIPEAGYVTEYNQGVYHLRHALHHMWFELCQHGVNTGHSGIQRRYTNEPELYLMG